MSYPYNDALYETLGAARDAAIDDWMSASGTQDVREALEPGDTPRTLARDMIAADWVVPGIHTMPPDPEIDKLAGAIAERLSTLLPNYEATRIAGDRASLTLYDATGPAGTVTMAPGDLHTLQEGQAAHCLETTTYYCCPGSLRVEAHPDDADAILLIFARGDHS
jgi:hypothetical protein